MLSYGLNLKLEQILSPKTQREATYNIPVELSVSQLFVQRQCRDNQAEKYEPKHHIQKLLQIIFLNPRLPDYDWTIKQSVLVCLLLLSSDESSRL